MVHKLIKTRHKNLHSLGPKCLYADQYMQWSHMFRKLHFRLSSILRNFAIYTNRVCRRVMEIFAIQFSHNNQHAIELARLLAQYRLSRDRHVNRFFFFALTFLIYC